ncbi:MAG: S41 family peptidase [Mucilaginibacter sp.]
MKRTAAIIFRSTILILIGVTIGLLISDNAYENNKLGFSFTNKDKVSKTLQLVRTTYVDSVNTDSIEGVTVNNLLQNLDPHSLYLPPKQATSVNERLEGGYNGIGISYILLRDTLFISQLNPGGPAAKAGLAAGNKIIAINNQPISGKSLTPDKVDNLFKDKNNETLQLTVLNNDGKLHTYEIKKDHIDLSSLDAAYMAAPLTGYIKISKFASTTDADFRADLLKLKKQGMQKLVLDLRGNGGGYLNTATALADEFLTSGQLIVYTKGVHEARTDYFATDSGNFQHGNLAVLIDENSASASEILAGALQDLDRATIVGRRSFGKGLVQEQFPFKDGSAINLTVARYYTPSGRSIQKSYKNGTESYRNELTERMKKGELFSEQNNLNDTLFTKQSPYHTANGRKVFSGGGIMPDIFVPADTTQNILLVKEIAARQLYMAYVLDRMQPELNKYTSVDVYLKQYTVSDKELGDFIKYAAQSIKGIDPKDVASSREFIKTKLKSYAARFKWGDEAYFKSINANDPVLKKGIEAVR